TVILAQEPEESIEQIFAALEFVLTSRNEGQSVCFHCAVGKHRTGLVSTLIEFAETKETSSAASKLIYERYLRHAWFGECATRIQTIEMIPTILDSAEFKDFKNRWNKN
ncbi:MAG: tyrosine-protein phosphatase, partial [Bdellovibrionia bacterium]